MAQHALACHSSLIPKENEADGGPQGYDHLVVDRSQQLAEHFDRVYNRCFASTEDDDDETAMDKSRSAAFA